MEGLRLIFALPSLSMLLLLMILSMSTSSAAPTSGGLSLLRSTSAGAPPYMLSIKFYTSSAGVPFYRSLRVFDITQNTVVPYSGPVVKRLAGSSAISIGELDFDLSDYFTLRKLHQYRVSVSTEGFLQRQQEVSVVLLCDRDTQAPSARREATVSPRRRRATGSFSTSGCSGTQIASFPQTLTLAETGSVESLRFLRDCDGEPYTRLFGAHSAQRKLRVNSTFTAVLSRLRAGGFTLVCNDPGCDPTTFAFVYPDDSSFNVYLCGVFFDGASPMLQYNSQPGTVIHELSHFTSIGGTDDHEYGLTSCEELARVNPALAVDNADSLEFFAELGPYYCGENDTFAPTQAPPPCPQRDLASALDSTEFTLPQGPNRYAFSCDEATTGPQYSLRWTAPSAGVYSFSTEGSAVQATLLDVRHSSDCYIGQVLGCSDDIVMGSATHSRVQVGLEGGQQVFLWVGGYYQSDHGTVRLTVAQEEAPSCPDQQVDSSAASVTFTLQPAAHLYEFSCAGGDSDGPETSIQFTALTDAEYTFSTEGSSFQDTVLEVKSSCLTGLIACHDDIEAGNYHSRVGPIPLQKGQLVIVWIGGYSASDTGPGTLTITSSAPPATTGTPTTRVPSVAPSVQPTVVAGSPSVSPTTQVPTTSTSLPTSASPTVSLGTDTPTSRSSTTPPATLLSTQTIIIIAAVGGGLLFILLIVGIACCVRKCSVGAFKRALQGDNGIDMV